MTPWRGLCPQAGVVAPEWNLVFCRNYLWTNRSENLIFKLHKTRQFSGTIL